jgi:hypothetical protein
MNHNFRTAKVREKYRFFKKFWIFPEESVHKTHSINSMLIRVGPPPDDKFFLTSSVSKLKSVF